MDPKILEQRIVAAGSNSPRVKPEDINALMGTVVYVISQPEGTTSTFCHAYLPGTNGKMFSLATGHSACVVPENFNAQIGRDLAQSKATSAAKDKLWELCGFALFNEMNKAPVHPLDHIARIAHEVNRAYCQALGDFSQPSWEDAPAWQRESARMGVDLHLSGDFGPEASHISWMNQKLDEGWHYGPVKDAEKKEHPCLVPFEQLSREQQAKDHLFRGVVHAFKNK